MADNILKLKVESSEYDQKLKKAAEGIRHLAEVAHKGGGDLAGLEKAELDYIKALGEMETKSRTASGQVRELSNTYKELKVIYNQLNEVEKADEGGKALAASLETIKQRAQAAKKELADVTAELDGTSIGEKGGFFDGLGSKMDGALAVFGGNLLTKGVTMLTSELAESVQQSIELAKQGEGVRMAFERLDQPGLLDSLKEATHGTISELELMKQAVKFENFKLPVEDLANYLAFAQQKAKDTGESIDYLVNSITTGLGRQSKQILDNLGISAAELTRRMNEGATMTQAVSDIIREEMAKAGDYVETAADRAARATADTQNKMEELGRSAMPVAEEFASAWAEIRNGAMSLVLPVLSIVADSIRDIREILGGEWDMPKLKPGIPNLAEGPANSNQPKRPTWGDVPVVKAPGGYVEVTDNSGKVLHGGHYDSDAQLQNMMKRWNTLTTPTRTSGSRPTAKKEQTEMQQNQTRINDLTQQYVSLMAAASEAGKPLTDEQQKQTSEIQRQISELEKRNGQLKLYQEQAQGKLLGPDAFRQQLSVDVAVNNKKIEELEKQLLSLNGITIDPKTVTITATDEALPKLHEIQGITVDDKTMTVTAETQEALQALQGIEGVTIDPKTVAITATDEALPKLREIQGITIDDKTMTVTAATQEALRALQGIEGVTIDPKTVTITATDEALPKLREIDGITIDDKTMTVTAATQEALQALQAVDGVTIDTKNVKVTAETDEARQKVEELKRQITELKDQNIQITAAMGSIGMPLSEMPRMGVTDATYGKGNNQFVPAPLMPSMDEVVRQRGGNLLDEKAMKAVDKEEKRNEKKEDKEQRSVVEGIDQLNGGISNIFGGLEQMGIEIPTELKSIFGVVQGVTTILMGIASTIIAIEALVGADTFLPFAKGGVVPKFADGGLVGRAALGIAIPGNSMSGDNLRLPVDGGRGVIGVNSGEVILNRAQQGVIASALDGGGASQNLKLDAVISGEQIRLVLNNNGRRTGRGEYVQSTRRR